MVSSSLWKQISCFWLVQSLLQKLSPAFFLRYFSFDFLFPLLPFYRSLFSFSKFSELSAALLGQEVKLVFFLPPWLALQWNPAASLII